MDESVHNDTRKTCRTCVRVHESKNDLISIFTEDQTMPSRKLQFSVMLSAVANHPVNENDAMPQRICMSCACSIRSAYFFKVQAESSYKLLQARTARPLEAQLITVKQEKADITTLQAVQESSEDVPLILEPRTLDSDANFSEDLLIELEPPRIQEPVSYVHDDEHVDSDADELIVYEPSEFTDQEQDELESMPEDTPEEQTSHIPNEKSPDSGLPSSPMPSTSNKEKSESPQSNLVCNVCNKYMFSEKAMIRHKRSSHSVNKCGFCKKRFGSKMHLKLHVRIRHPLRYNEFRLNGQLEAVVQVEPVTEIPECDSCGTCFCNKQALFKHRADCDLKCSECGLILHYKESYLLHLSKEHNIIVEHNTLLECPFGCTTKFKTDKTLQEHIEQTHPDPVDDDSWVDMPSDGEDSTQSGPFTLHSCQTCDAVFKSHNSLTQHNCKNKKKAPAPEKPKTRNVPKYTRDEFVEKFMVHKTQETSRCLACNFDVGRKSVNCHLKNKHASVKTYRCELCSEAFFRGDYRMRHMAATHPKQYRCVNCSVQFDRIYKYDAHMEIHGIKAKNFKPADGQDNYDLGSDTMKYIEDMSTFDYSSCPIQRRLSVASAPATVTSRAEMPLPKDEFVKKYFKHLPDGKWQCTVCAQDMQYSSIHSHVLWRHAVKKPFKCPFCNERSVKHLARMSHMNRCHPNEYRCNICLNQSAQHAIYAAHMWEQHRQAVFTQPSNGEEPDLTTDNLRFVTQKPEDEVIQESEDVLFEQDFKNSTKSKRDPASVQVYKEDNREMTFEEFRSNFLEDNELDYKCLICDRTLRKRNIGSHVKSRHATTGAFKCAVCPEAFFRPEHRIQHMAEKHRGMFHCQWCNIQFYRNSRYAVHLKQQHDIEVDDTDEYEVDLNLNQVMYIAKIVRNDDSLPSIVHDPEPEPEEEQEAPSYEEVQPEEGLIRSNFVAKYFRAHGKESRRCEPCNKVVPNGSVHHHLMHEHALMYPYKCPFCDLRLYFASLRVRHMQVFHPNDYKCHECALQFQNHSKFSEHMLVEHGRTDIQEKSPLEIPDISTNAIRYAVYKNGEDGDNFQDESSSSTVMSTIVPQSAPSTSKAKDVFLKPKIKEEPRYDEIIMHSIFGNDDTDLYGNQEDESDQEGLSYNDFIAQLTFEHENGHITCKPCDKTFLRTSISQHMRNKHTTTNGYKCELCPMGFLVGELRRKHMIEAHPTDYVCSKCPIQFYYSITYKKHMKEVHKTNVNVHIQKLADEVDIPLDRLRFAEHPKRIPLKLPRSHSKTFNGGDGGAKNVVALSYDDFIAQYIGDKDDKSFRCIPCDKTISKMFYKIHLVRYHSIGKHYGCQLCNDTFKKKQTRLRHMAAKHENDFKCYDCVVQFDTASVYKEHMRISHNKIVAVRVAKPESEMDVPIEQMSYSAAVTVVTGNTRFNVPKNTYDDVPNDILLNRDQLYGKFYRSIKKNSNETGIAKTKCLACNKIFSSQNRSLHAFYNHAVARPFKCELCSHKGFFTRMKRLTHMKVAHSNEYTCLQCNKQYDRAHEYAAHMKQHQVTVVIPHFDEDEINVPVDKMGYMMNRSIAKVMLKEKFGKAKAQAEKTPVHVNVPADTSNVASDVQQYFSAVSNQSSKCAICHREFLTSRALRIHLRNHTDGDFQQMQNDDVVTIDPIPVATPPPVVIVEKNEECDVCGNKFATPFALNAHKKMKHELVWKKRRSSVYAPSGRFFEFFCDICDFTSTRRDYLDRHVGAAHSPEFRCQFCNKQMSNYNYYSFHLHDYHPTVAENAHLNSIKCTDCYKCFSTEENRDSHKQTMHRTGKTFPKHYCPVCCVSLGDKNGLECHKVLKSHKQHVKFLSGKTVISDLYASVGETEPCSVASDPKPESSPSVTAVKAKLPTLKPSERPTRIKAEPIEAAPVTVTKTRSFFKARTGLTSPEPNGTDPMLAMMSKSVKSEEPARKRTRLSSSAVASSSSRSSLEEPISGEEDKMEYLKYLKTVDNMFECGICGKRKNVRKYMLHHLKQHKEIPTYQCSQCQEKFVFKRKYELHLETHSAGVSQREVIDVDDHPKFQVTEPQVDKIECKICQQSFRLTIMLNRHNTQWHDESNPDRELSAHDQKSKKESSKLEPTVIKVIKCKFCSEAFIRAADLEVHMNEKHTPVQDEAEEDEEGESAGASSNSVFTCDKCNFVFNEQKFLENHQLFFCQHRVKTAQAMNEQ